MASSLIRFTTRSHALHRCSSSAAASFSSAGVRATDDTRCFAASLLLLPPRQDLFCEAFPKADGLGGAAPNAKLVAEPRRPCDGEWRASALSEFRRFASALCSTVAASTLKKRWRVGAETIRQN